MREGRWSGGSEGGDPMIPKLSRSTRRGWNNLNGWVGSNGGGGGGEARRLGGPEQHLGDSAAGGEAAGRELLPRGSWGGSPSCSPSCSPALAWTQLLFQSTGADCGGNFPALPAAGLLGRAGEPGGRTAGSFYPVPTLFCRPNQLPGKAGRPVGFGLSQTKTVI